MQTSSVMKSQLADSEEADHPDVPKFNTVHQ